MRLLLLALVLLVQEEYRREPAEPMSYRGALWLERADREAEERSDLVIEAMGLEPGDVVADVGTGSGFYARRIAPRVMPNGKVYAVDIQPEMLQFLRQLVEEEGVEGVVPVLSEPDDPNLPEGAVDWILLADVYHEIASPETMLEELRKALAPDGRVALVEYRVEDGSADHIKADHTMSVRQVLQEWKPAGFELVELHESLPSQHLFVFHSKGSGGTERIADHDLLEALQKGIVEAEASAGERGTVHVRIRRRVERPMVVTAPVGIYFDGEHDELARRDAAIRLFDDGWYEWVVLSVSRDEKTEPGEPLRMKPPEAAPSELRRLLRAIQTGTYRLADGSRFYPARTLEVEQAAVWIAERDPSYEELVPELEKGPMSPGLASAFALVFCDASGIDVTEKRIWQDANAIFSGVWDPRLKQWYQRRARQRAAPAGGWHGSLPMGLIGRTRNVGTGFFSRSGARTRTRRTGSPSPCPYRR